MPRALVVGDVMMDIGVRLRESFARGSDAAASIVERPGGSAATFAVWLARNGVEVEFFGRVGTADVQSLTAKFRSMGVSAELRADSSATGRLIAIVEPSGERSFLTDRGANDSLRREDIPEAAAANADWLHLTGYSFQNPGVRTVALDLMRRVRGIPISVDPGSWAPLRVMGADKFLEWTTGATLLMPNADEAAVLTGVEDVEAQLACLARRYPLVVIKQGAGGAVAASGERRWSVPAPAVRAIDSTGAGDSFAAAFVASRLAGHDVGFSLERAVAAGAYATTYLGAWPP